jgi:hypothetical protein
VIDGPDEFFPPLKRAFPVPAPFCETVPETPVPPPDGTELPPSDWAQIFVDDVARINNAAPRSKCVFIVLVCCANDLPLDGRSMFSSYGAVPDAPLVDVLFWNPEFSSP